MSNGYVDIDRNGVADYRQNYIDRNHNRVDDRVEARWSYGNNWCPPGLAKKNNGCLPPGQSQARIPRRPALDRATIVTGRRTTRSRTTCGPATISMLSTVTIYRDGYIYAVDPRTNMVTRIINLFL